MDFWFIIIKADKWPLAENKLVLVIDLFSYAFWYFTLYFTGRVNWGNYTRSPASTYVATFSSQLRSPLGKTPPVLFAILFSLHRSHPMFGRKFSNISLQYCYRRNRGYCLLIHKRFSQPLTQPQRKLCLFLVWDQGLSGIMLRHFAVVTLYCTTKSL